MRVALVAIVAIVAAAVVGCSTGTTADTSSAFTGSWSCSTTDALTYTQPPGSEDKTETTTDTLVITTTGDGTFTSVTYLDAGTSCGLKYTPSGNSASLGSGQTCTAKGLTFSYVTGDAEVSGGSLTVTLR